MTERLEQIKALVAEDPEAPMPHYMLANEYWRAGQLEEAAHHARTYLGKVEGGDVGAAYGLLGRALAGLRRHEEARRAFETGIRAALAYNHRGLAAELQEELQRLEGG